MDNDSKFGTLVRVREGIRIDRDARECVQLQFGRTLVGIGGREGVHFKNVLNHINKEEVLVNKNASKLREKSNNMVIEEDASLINGQVNQEDIEE